MPTRWCARPRTKFASKKDPDRWNLAVVVFPRRSHLPNIDIGSTGLRSLVLRHSKIQMRRRHRRHRSPLPYAKIAKQTHLVQKPGPYHNAPKLSSPRETRSRPPLFKNAAAATDYRSMRCIVGGQREIRTLNDPSETQLRCRNRAKVKSSGPEN